MQYIIQKSQPVDTGFAEQVEQKSKTNVRRCYQCLTCTLSCPASFSMDYLPHQLMRMVQAGLREQVLNSHTIWVCADCKACAARCPNEVDIPAVMDALREMALAEGRPPEESVTSLHRIFLDNISRWGRQHELFLILRHKLKTRNFFADMGAGVQMLLKGKLNFVPAKLKGISGVKAIFRRTGTNVQ